MKSFIAFTWLFIAVLMPRLNAAGTDTVFSPGGPLELVRGKDRGQQISYTTGSDGKEKLTFAPDPAANTAKVMELFIPRQSRRPIVEKVPGKAFLTVSVENKFFTGIALRVSDKDNETFQLLPEKTEENKNGDKLQIRYTYDISESAIKGSWGPKVNRQFDGSVSIAGFGVMFQAGNTAGKVVFESLELENPAPANTSALLIEGFTNPCSLQVVQGEKRGQKTSFRPNADGVEKLSFSLDANSRHGNLELYTPGQKQRPALPAAPMKVILTVSADKAFFNRIALRISDKDNETFHFLPDKSSQDNVNGKVRMTFVFNISEDAVKASWGPKVNRKFDGQLSFMGLSVIFKKGETSGNITFESLELLQQKDKAATMVQNVLSFHQDLSLDQIFARQGNCRAKADTATGKLEVSGNARWLFINPYCWKEMLFLPAPENITLLCKNISVPGKAVLKLETEQKKRFSLQKSFAPGKTVSISFPCLGLNPDEKIRYTGLQFIFDRPMESSFEILNMVQTAAIHAKEALFCDIDTGNPLHLLFTGKESGFRFCFSNKSTQPVDLPVEITLRDFHGHKITFNEKIALDAGKSISLPLSRKLPCRGHWDVIFKVSGKEEDERFAEETIRSFAFMDRIPDTPRPGNNSFLFGICAHPTWLYRADEYPLFVRAMRESGAKILRTDFIWRQMEPEEGKWSFAIYDPLVRDMAKNNIGIMAVLHPTPPWAVRKEKENASYWVKSRSLPRSGLFENYASKVAERYKEEITLYEITNEPDLLPASTLTTDEHLTVLAEAARGIRRHRVPGRITTAGFAVVSSPQVPQKDMQLRVLKEGREYFDVHCIHLHGPFANYASIINGSFAVLRKAANCTAPWIAGETAIHAAGGTEKQQAVTLFKKHAFTRTGNAVGYIWYNLRNKGRSFYNGEHHYGLFTYDFYPNEVFTVFAEIARTFDGTVFEKELKLKSSMYAFVFRRDNRKVIPFWNQNDTAPTELMIFRTDAKKAVLSDIMGNRKDLAISSGILILPVSGEPGTLILEDAEKIEYLGPMLEITAPNAIVPGGSYSITAKVRNPAAEKITLIGNLTASDNINLIDQNIRREIAPGSREIIPIRFETRKNTAPNSISFVELQGNIPGSSFRVQSRMHTAKLIPRDNGDQPHFVLDNIKNTVTFLVADPLTEYRNWAGVQDLSAKIRYARDDKNLLIRITVTDDKHHQPYSGTGVWQGDNIQLPLVFPSQNGDIWEFGLSLLNSGKSEIFIWTGAKGFDPAKTAQACTLDVQRKGNITDYRLSVPFSAIGITEQDLKNGFRSNVLINENDGDGRDYGMFIAPGTHTTKLPDEYPFLIME